jgi:hypothetical protein
MATGWYEQKRDVTVKNALTKYGMAMTLIVPADGTFDEETGGLTQGTDKSYTVQGMVGNFRKSRKADSSVLAKSRYIYLSPSGMAVEPRVGNRLRVASVEYEILNVEDIAPAGITVLYQIEARLP